MVDFGIDVYFKRWKKHDLVCVLVEATSPSIQSFFSLTAFLPPPNSLGEIEAPYLGVFQQKIVCEHVSQNGIITFYEVENGQGLPTDSNTLVMPIAGSNDSYHVCEIARLPAPQMAQVISSLCVVSCRSKNSWKHKLHQLRLCKPI